MKKGVENNENEVRLHTPWCRPPKHSVMKFCLKLQVQNCEKAPVNNFEAAEQGLTFFGYVSGRFFEFFISLVVLDSKVPEGHHPRGTTLREALRGKLPLRVRGSLRGLCGVSPLRGSAGVRGIFRGFSGVVTLCL